ncbi:MAG: hypothetical protein IJF07_00485 [Lachnospiraceae bacterium]|nr:hypothetical protein [Lachnospiraceae bacterium]
MAAYERPEELKLQDKIQFCQEHMQVLELELDKRRFQYKCHPQKEKVAHRNMKEGIIFGVILSVVFVWSLVSAIGELNGGGIGGYADAMGVILTMCVAAYSAIYGCKLWINVIHTKNKLSILQSEKECLESEIPSLEARIDELYFEISSLTAKQKKLQGSKS